MTKTEFYGKIKSPENDIPEEKRYDLLKILIVGCGEVGETLARELSREGYDLTLLDSDPAVLESGLERYDVMTVQGNGASVKALRQAEIEKTDLLIATTGSDEMNLLSCVTAHALNPDLHTIARIRNPEYAEQAYSMQSTFGLSMTFNPEYQAAVEIERLIKFPGFFKRDSFARGRVEIVELRVDEDSILKNVQLISLPSIVKCQVLVCTVLRDGEPVIPNGSFVLEEGDRVFVTAQSDDLAKLLKNLGIMTRKVRRVLTVGGGRVGYYLASLLKNSPVNLTLVDSDPARCDLLAAEFPDVSVILGDAKDQTLLESEDIAHADALVAVTGDDEFNLLLSLYGKRRGVPFNIARLDELDTDWVSDEMSVGSVICPRILSCNSILRFVRAMQNKSGAALTVHLIADGHAQAMEFQVSADTPFIGEPLKKISGNLRKNVRIASIHRGGTTIIPNGESFYLDGDSIVVVAAEDCLIRQIDDIFD